MTKMPFILREFIHKVLAIRKQIRGFFAVATLHFRRRTLLDGLKEPKSHPFFLVSTPFMLLPIIIIFLSVSQLEEAVRMVSECGSDGSVAVKHGSPVAWQLNRILDFVAATYGGVVFRRRIPLFYQI